MSNYDRLYDEINKIVSERYILLKDKKIDWNAIVQKYKSQLKCICDSTQFVNMINDMLLELKDGHVNFSDITQIPSYYLPFNINFIQNNLVVTSDDGNIPKGAIILKINDKKIIDLINYYPSSFSLTSTKIKVLENIHKKIKKDVSLEYAFNEHTFKKVVECKKITPDFIKETQMLINKNPFSGIQTKLINDIHYLKIFGFIENVHQSVLDWFIKLPLNQNIIIDLRGCSGGSILETIEVTRLFLERSVNLGKKVSNINGEYIEQELNVDTSTINKHFKKIVILVDNFTCSSSEFIFLRALSKNKNVTLVGEETAGIVHGANNFIINNQYLLTLTTHKYYDENGLLLSGKGIVPDVFVSNDINSDSDNYLESAVKLFKKQNC